MNAPTPEPEVQVWLLLRDVHTATEVLGVYASPAALEFGILEMFRRSEDIGGLRAENWVVTGGAPRPVVPGTMPPPFVPPGRLPVPPAGNEGRSPS
jgi:hypothetical protein